MKNTALGLFTVLLLGGCADSAMDAKPVGSQSPAASADVAAQDPILHSDGSESDLKTTAVASSVDAERLLASTLENAKTQNKRVMVHLGAPW